MSTRTDQPAREVYRFPRAEREHVVAEHFAHKGVAHVQLRVVQVAHNGTQYYTPKGITVNAALLPELLAAVQALVATEVEG